MISRIIFVFTVLIPSVFCRPDVRHQSTAPTQCEDVIANCDLLEPKYYCVGDYYSWAWKNCRKTCNLCDIQRLTTIDPDKTTTHAPGCVYNGHLYKQNDNWITNDMLNCTCIDGNTGYYRCRDQPCLHPDCIGYGPENGFLLPGRPGELDVCVYKGQQYMQDQSWDDGCIQTCTCTSAAEGLYSCRAVCLNWANLPSVCYLEDVPPGLCCRQPRCKSDIVINIPKSYKLQYPGYNYV